MAEQENKLLFVGDNLMELLNHLKEQKQLNRYTISDFCEDYNLSYGSWVRVFRNDVKLGTSLLLALLEHFPNLNYNWLFLSKGPMFQDGEYKEEIKAESIDVQLELKELKESINKINKRLNI